MIFERILSFMDPTLWSLNRRTSTLWRNSFFGDTAPPTYKHHPIQIHHPASCIMATYKMFLELLSWLVVLYLLLVSFSTQVQASPMTMAACSSLCAAGAGMCGGMATYKIFLEISSWLGVLYRYPYTRWRWYRRRCREGRSTVYAVSNADAIDVDLFVICW